MSFFGFQNDFSLPGRLCHPLSRVPWKPPALNSEKPQGFRVEGLGFRVEGCRVFHIGALAIRIGFWGSFLVYSEKDPDKAEPHIPGALVPRSRSFRPIRPKFKSYITKCYEYNRTPKFRNSKTRVQPGRALSWKRSSSIGSGAIRCWAALQIQNKSPTLCRPSDPEKEGALFPWSTNPYG